jgi:hypothetical protein
MPTLLLPEQVRARCARQFAREHLAWLGSGGGSAWPLSVPLGAPTQDEAAADPAAVRAWVAAWDAWQAGGLPGQLVWATRQWPRLGTQHLPVSLALGSAAEVALLAGQATRWQRALARQRLLCEACTWLQDRPATQRQFDALADQGDAEFDRLLALVRWLVQHPSSGLLLRQLPVAGLDTKWVEQRRGLVADLMLARGPGTSAEPAGRDLHALLGLSKPPQRLRLRLLCTELQRQVGGLCDIEAPWAELAALPVAPQQVLVVENLESGLALPAMPGTLALMKLGHAVQPLRLLPWLPAARVVVWGDIDTHGYAILDRVRSLLPHAESMLMDGDTLLAHRPLWAEEAQPYAGPPLERLHAAERWVFEGLVQGRWGAGVRLEQERLPWPLVLTVLGRLRPTAADAWPVTGPVTGAQAA